MKREAIEAYWREAVNKHARAVHDRIHQKWPGEFTKYTPGAEQTAGSKTAIVRYLTDKTVASKDPATFIQSF